jgi:HEAT repeat protein
VSILVASGCPSVTRANEEPAFKQLLEELIPGMGAEHIPDRRDSQQRFQAVCFQLGAPGREAERAEACQRIAERLGPETAKPARIWLLKQLQFVGRGECVDAVAAVLDDNDPHVRDAARRALQNNPAPEANAKLLAALPGSSGSWRVGLVNSLGARRDPTSVPALARILDDQDRAAVEAAANALGKIAGAEATDALAAALAGASGQTKTHIADAYLRCADKLLAAGNKDEALAIYSRLHTPDSARVIRLAALQGLLNAAGDQAGDQIIELLQGDDPDARAIAAGQVESVLGSGALRASEETFSELSSPAKILLLAALAVRGDESATSVAVRAANSDDENVRLAGIRALGTLGNASVVPLLIKALTTGGTESDAAEETLKRLSATGVNEAVLEALKQAEPGLRSTLIEVLGARKAAIAVPALFEEAEHEDDRVRATAVAALGTVAEPKDIGAMLMLLLRTPNGRQRDDLEKAIVLVAGRIEEKDRQADPVLEELARVDEQQRSLLLPLLGRIGGRKALDSIHEAMKSKTAEVQDAAVRGLCNWPDAGVADELLKLAESAENTARRTWALRAYVRVIALPTDRPPRKSLEMFQKAMELAERDEEKRLIVDRASTVRLVDTLRWVVPFLHDDALSQEACRTVVELAHHQGLREPNRAEFEPALKKVIQISDDNGLIDRAKRYLEGLP